MRKAFILTIDALFCLALMLILSTSIFVYSHHQTSDSRLVQLNVLARDYLRLGGHNVWFENSVNYTTLFQPKTGIELTTTKPITDKQMVHAVIYKYPAVCGAINGTFPSNGQVIPLSKADADACLLSSDLLANGGLVKAEVWAVLPQ
ncbi:MAG: hypothetical protein V1811_01115 [Candidatus Micrarchaeota archaeon]